MDISLDIPKKQIIYFIHDSYNIYTFDIINNTFNKIYRINNPPTLYYFYEYFDNNSELFIFLENNILIFNNNQEVPVSIKHNIDYRELVDIVKYKDKYYILTRSKIYIMTYNITDIQEYSLPTYIKYVSHYNKYVKLLIYNDELYYTNYSDNEINDTHTNLELNLLKIDLEKNEFTIKQLFEKKVLNFIDHNFAIPGYCLHNINIYEENIVCAITDNTVDKTLLISYDLKNQIIKTKVINYNKITLKLLYNNIFITDNSSYNYKEKFMLYNIKTLDFMDTIKIDIPPENGYFKIINILNKLYIISNKTKSNNFGMLVYERETTEKNIKTAIFILKNFFKKNLNIDYGCYQDVKQYILEYVNAKTELDEEDNVTSCVITDNNYKFIKEVAL